MKTEHIQKMVKIQTYALGATNLYGVIRVDELMNLYKHYEKEDILKTVFNEALSTLKEALSINFWFEKDMISNGFFALNEPVDYKEALALLKIQETKPRYLPKLKEFLRYEDEDYVEPMKPLLDFENFIINNKLVSNRSRQDIKYDVLELHDIIVFGGKTTLFFDFIQKNGYQFKDQQQLQLFMGFIQLINNHTRMYENNGHAPTEIQKLTANK